MKQLEFQSDNQAETRDVRHVFLVTPAACSVQRIIVMSPCPQPAQYVTLLCGDWRYLEIGTLMTHLLLILILIKRCSPAQQYTRAQYRQSEYNTCHLPKHSRQIIFLLAMVESTTPNILGVHAKDIEYNFASCAVKPFLQTDPLVSVLSDSIMLCVFPCQAGQCGVRYVTQYCQYGACCPTMILFLLFSPLPTCCPGRAGRGGAGAQAGAPPLIPHQPSQRHVGCHSSTITLPRTTFLS